MSNTDSLIDSLLSRITNLRLIANGAAKILETYSAEIHSLFRSQNRHDLAEILGDIENAVSWMRDELMRPMETGESGARTPDAWPRS